jgi:hypothetical protein
MRDIFVATLRIHALIAAASRPLYISKNALLLRTRQAPRGYDDAQQLLPQRRPTTQQQRRGATLLPLLLLLPQTARAKRPTFSAPPAAGFAPSTRDALPLVDLVIISSSQLLVSFCAS